MCISTRWLPWHAYFRRTYSLLLFVNAQILSGKPGTCSLRIWIWSFGKFVLLSMHIILIWIWFDYNAINAHILIFNIDWELLLSTASDIGNWASLQQTATMIKLYQKAFASFNILYIQYPFNHTLTHLYSFNDASQITNIILYIWFVS